MHVATSYSLWMILNFATLFVCILMQIQLQKHVKCQQMRQHLWQKNLDKLLSWEKKFIDWQCVKAEDNRKHYDRTNSETYREIAWKRPYLLLTKLLNFSILCPNRHCPSKYLVKAQWSGERTWVCVNVVCVGDRGTHEMHIMRDTAEYFHSPTGQNIWGGTTYRRGWPNPRHAIII